MNCGNAQAAMQRLPEIAFRLSETVNAQAQRKQVSLSGKQVSLSGRKSLSDRTLVVLVIRFTVVICKCML